jgi:hypothetical protein
MRSILGIDAKALKYPDYAHSFFNKLPIEFTTVNAVPIGEQHKLSKRKVERPLLGVPKLERHKLARITHQKVQE